MKIWSIFLQFSSPYELQINFRNQAGSNLNIVLLSTVMELLMRHDVQAWWGGEQEQFSAQVEREGEAISTYLFVQFE